MGVICNQCEMAVEQELSLLGWTTSDAWIPQESHMLQCHLQIWILCHFQLHQVLLHWSSLLLQLLEMSLSQPTHPSSLLVRLQVSRVSQVSQRHQVSQHRQRVVSVEKEAGNVAERISLRIVNDSVVPKDYGAKLQIMPSKVAAVGQTGIFGYQMLTNR